MKANVSMDTLRALNTGHPLLISAIGSKPPPILPMVESIYTIATGTAICVIVRLYWLSRKSGSQNK